MEVTVKTGLTVEDFISKLIRCNMAFFTSDLCWIFSFELVVSFVLVKIINVFVSFSILIIGPNSDDCLKYTITKI